MKKILLLLTIIILNSMVFAHDCCTREHKPDKQQRKQINEFLIERLNLTEEQQNNLSKNQSEHRKKIKKIIKEMEVEHDKIRDIYLTGIPKFQADIKSAPHKAKLVILKQNADKLKEERRKFFDSILTKEQKIEFEKIKKEYQDKKHS